MKGVCTAEWFMELNLPISIANPSATGQRRIDRKDAKSVRIDYPVLYDSLVHMRTCMQGHGRASAIRWLQAANQSGSTAGDTASLTAKRYPGARA